MPSILFVKTSSLGDVVHNGPAVSDLRRALPGAAIDWVVEESFVEVARLHAAVRRAIPVAARRWRRRLYDPATWRELSAFRRALRAERYECVIDTQGLVKSALIAASARGEKHGFDAASVRERLAASIYDVHHAVPLALHAVERNRRLACAAMDIAVEGPAEYGFATAPDANHAGGNSAVVFLTMTSRADKLWPEANWRDLLAWLASCGQNCLLPWGSETERARCNRIAAGFPHASVAERMTITDLAPLLRRARAVVGVDTGLTHLAAGLGVPTAGIYCSSDPALTGLYAATPVRNIGARGALPSVDELRAVLEAWL
ncbi:MAG: lipopolysaccharide heptosyltransferase I [Betaproteobacteria bacterium]|nr:lipopolysaccharide heptosyltransferase I [Betaproteobacteria bacterium]